MRDVLFDNGVAQKKHIANQVYDPFHRCSWTGVQQCLNAAMHSFLCHMHAAQCKNEHVATASESCDGSNPDAHMFAVDGAGELHSKDESWINMEKPLVMLIMTTPLSPNTLNISRCTRSGGCFGDCARDIHGRQSWGHRTFQVMHCGQCV